MIFDGVLIEDVMGSNYYKHRQWIEKGTLVKVLLVRAGSAYFKNGKLAQYFTTPQYVIVHQSFTALATFSDVRLFS